MNQGGAQYNRGAPAQDKRIGYQRVYLAGACGLNQKRTIGSEHTRDQPVVRFTQVRGVLLTGNGGLSARVIPG